MTDAQLQTLADEYTRLEKLLDRNKARRFPDLADLHYLEDRMARIELKFQQADADIRQWTT